MISQAVNHSTEENTVTKAQLNFQVKSRLFQIEQIEERSSQLVRNLSSYEKKA